MSSNLYDSPTNGYYSHFTEEEIEAAMDPGPLYPSLSSKLQFIQQDGFCLNFSVHMFWQSDLFRCVNLPFTCCHGDPTSQVAETGW